MSLQLYVNANPAHLIFLNRGCYVPFVATVQVLLCQYPPHADLKIDQIFGPKTEAAVRHFQEYHGLKVDGIVGNKTWKSLSRVSGLIIADVVNASEPKLLNGVREAIARAHGELIEISPGSAGVDEFVQKVADRGNEGPIALLRIHGHGNVGYQTLSVYEQPEALGSIDSASSPEVLEELGLLKPYFSRIGAAQLHGCEVGSGNPGSALLWRLATAWGVPVTAGSGTQHYAGADNFRFESGGQTQRPVGWKEFMTKASKIKKGEHRRPLTPGVSVAPSWR